MRSLLVTRNLPPLVGGMERVSLEIWRALESAGKCEVVGPSAAAAQLPNARRLHGVALKPLSRFLVFATIVALCRSLAHRPKLVVAGSGLTAPIAWVAARLVGARCAVYLHGLDVIAPSRVYQRIWLPFVRACDITICNSRNTMALALSRGVPESSLVVLNPGTTVPEDRRGPPSNVFRTTFDLGGAPILLSVGRFTRRKGLAEFVEHGLPKVVAALPEALLVIVGEEASDALHGTSSGERDRIFEAAVSAGVSANVRFVGRCSEALLDAAYDESSCHVFPILDLPGDVEGFGMVALEAAARGLLTVGFRVGGVEDAVSEPASGTLVNAGDYEGLATALIRSVGAPSTPEGREAARQFARKFEWHLFSQRLLDIVS